jgi:hypothetical protein
MNDTEIIPPNFHRRGSYPQDIPARCQNSLQQSFLSTPRSCRKSRNGESGEYRVARRNSSLTVIEHDLWEQVIIGARSHQVHRRE